MMCSPRKVGKRRMTEILVNIMREEGLTVDVYEWKPDPAILELEAACMRKSAEDIIASLPMPCEEVSYPGVWEAMAKVLGAPEKEEHARPEPDVPESVVDEAVESEVMMAGVD